MTLRELPIVGTVYDSGADDRIYDGLLLMGPVIIVLLVVLESVVEQAIVAELFAIAYIVIFVGYVLLRGVASVET